MKNLRSRTYFLLAALALLFAHGTHARGQTKKHEPPPPPAPRTRGPSVIAPVAKPVEWKEFRSEAGGFKVKLPGTPQLTQAPMQKGPVTVTRNVYSVDLGGMRFEVDYVDTPPGYLDPDLSLEGGISGLVNAMQARGARVLSRSSVTNGGCEGREVTLATAVMPGRDGFAQARIYTSGARIYIMLFVSIENSAQAREAARTFTESFEVEGGCTALVAPTQAPPARKVVSNVEGELDRSTGWRRIQEEELGFSVLMPGRAQHVSELAQVEPFPITHHTYMNESESELYTVEVLGEYPPGFHNRPESYRTMVDVTLYAAQKNFEPHGFKIAPLRDLRVGAYPGREFTLTNEKLGAQGRLQIYATPKHVYLFTAFKRGAAPGPGVERFFASVRVSPK